MQTLKISIGRSQDNDFIVNDPKVSAHHAEFIRDACGIMFIIDLGSSNGTQVNGAEVMKKKISLGDEVMLGNSVRLTARDLLRNVNDYTADFAELKNVYEKYQRDKNHIQSSGQVKTGLVRSLPFALPGLAGLLLSMGTNPALTALSVFVSIGAPVAGMVLATRQSSKIPEKLNALADQLKIDYVCPKCGVFLGELPWESLSKRKMCYCKARWVDEDSLINNQFKKN
jgi:hypothetical protein